MKSKFLFLILLMFGIVRAHGSTVDTIITHSLLMGKNIKSVVIIPKVKAGERMGVVYLLHGFGGNYADWIKNVPELSLFSEQFRLIVVCPDGNRSSWYIDSPVDTSSKYESYITQELIPYIDQHYPTIAMAADRGITGLSMGGFGAFYLGIRHPELFGAIGSMSGGVDVRPFPGNWDLSKLLGKYEQKPENWDRLYIGGMMSQLVKNKPAIIFDCGYDDFFFKVNESLHYTMLSNNVAHDFIVRPGKHSWEYWKNSIAYQLLFMDKFFKKAEPSAH